MSVAIVSQKLHCAKTWQLQFAFFLNGAMEMPVLTNDIIDNIV
jgi:hypothetical protein